MFTSLLISKLCTKLLKKGKKTKAEKLVKNILYIISLNTHFKPVPFFFIALLNLRPLLEFRQVKRGRNLLKIPFPLKKKRRLSLAFRFLLEKTIKRNKAFTLANKIIDIKNGTAPEVLYISDFHNEIRQGRPFSHFRWV